ncbi:WD40 repeat domain-containing protein, partial [Undibacterium sp. Di24W]|uniref:WD40 repeat domain-containing protein n=1 Tax=Undibacterium sp. Di24W TaxID=3413033 RepID=UPI003BF2029C
MTVLSTVYNNSNAQDQFKLTLNLEQHHDWVNQIAGNPSSTFFITTSYDGSARVWDSNNLKLKKVIWAPLSKGETRYWESVTVSPDNRLIALGLSSKSGSHQVYFIDTENFEIKNQLSLEGGVPKVLRFAPDNKTIFIIEDAASKLAIKIFDIETRKHVNSIALPERFADIHGFEISPDGNYLALGILNPLPSTIYVLKSTGDGWVPVNTQLREGFQIPERVSGPVFAFSPKGDLAVTFENGFGAIQIYRKSSDYKKRTSLVDSCEDGKLETAIKNNICDLPNPRGSERSFGVKTMRWTMKGDRLWLGYLFSRHVRELDLANFLQTDSDENLLQKAPFSDIKINETAKMILPLVDGSIIAATGVAKSNGLIKINSNRVILEKSPVDLNDALYSETSFPKKEIGENKYICSKKYNKKEIIFDVSTSQIIFPSEDCSFSFPYLNIDSTAFKLGQFKPEIVENDYSDQFVLSSRGVKQYWIGDSYSDLKDGDPFAQIKAAVKHDSMWPPAPYPTPGHKHLIFVSPERVQLISNDGHLKWQFLLAGASVSLINYSTDGSLVIFAMSDGTNRIHKMENGNHLMTMIVDKQANRMVAWTSSGYYTASPGAEDWFGFLVQKENQTLPDFVPASRFRETLNRPDIVEKILQFQDESKSIVSANEKQGIRPNTETTNFTPISQLPPVLDLLSNIETEANTPTTKLRVRVRTSENSP